MLDPSYQTPLAMMGGHDWCWVLRGVMKHDDLVHKIREDHKAEEGITASELILHNEPQSLWALSGQFIATSFQWSIARRSLACLLACLRAISNSDVQQATYHIHIFIRRPRCSIQIQVQYGVPHFLILFLILFLFLFMFNLDPMHGRQG